MDDRSKHVRGRAAARGGGCRSRTRRPRGWQASLRLAAFAAAAACALAPAAGARSEDVRYVLDDFESATWPDPALWTVPDDAAAWRPSACRSADGMRALRAFAAADAPCDAAIPPGAASSAFLHLDLRAAGAANRLELGFDVWFHLAAAEEAGLVVWLRVPRPGGGADRVPVFGATGDGGAWASPPRHLDLRNLVDVRNPAAVYDLRGAEWTLEWTAAAPAGAPPGGGVFIDRLALTWEPDPSYPTPTRRPTLPPTATRPRPTPSRTATPTDEPTPTEVPPTVSSTPSAGRAFLPILRHDPPPTPTATPSATQTETATTTPDPNGTPPPLASAIVPASATPLPSPTPADEEPVRSATAGQPAMLSSPEHAPVAQWTEQLASNQ